MEAIFPLCVLCASVATLDLVFMKIVHIITRLIIGGAQENTLLSCEGQHRLGHEVTLLTGPPLGPEGSLMYRAQQAGYRVEVLNEMRRSLLPIRDYLTYHKLIDRLKDLKPDVVHTHSSKAGIIGRWAAHRAGVPKIVHTIHGLAFTASTRKSVNGFYKFCERHTAPITDNIVCVADSMRDQSLAENIGSRDQYVTVYSGMDTAPFVNPPVPRETVRDSYSVRDDDILVGTIARLFHLKGHDDLLDLAPELCAKHPKLKFFWVGDGLLRSAFEARITEMNLKDRFILTGLVKPDKIPQLVNAMDILVHPSRREGLARALPQGSLAKIPVVTYDIDGAKEGVLDGVTGFVHRPFDKRALAESISKLVDDAALRATMGEAGRRFALSRFDTQVMVNDLEKVYVS